MSLWTLEESEDGGWRIVDTGGRVVADMIERESEGRMLAASLDLYGALDGLVVNIVQGKAWGAALHEARAVLNGIVDAPIKRAPLAPTSAKMRPKTVRTAPSEVAPCPPAPKKRTVIRHLRKRKDLSWIRDR